LLPTQPPATSQVSFWVQALPSLHEICCWHPRAPSHLPVLPQGPVAFAQVEVPARGSCPLASGEHTPTLPVTEQLSQAPVHTELQQVPSTQWTLLQSVPVLHDSPSGNLSPHRLVCRLHVTLALQSPLSRQVLRQLGLVVLQA
jgi:hypothetical protein